MIRLIRRVVGLFVILLGLFLGLMAAVGLTTDHTNDGRNFAIGFAVAAIVLLFIGGRLTKSPSRSLNQIDSSGPTPIPPQAVADDEGEPLTAPETSNPESVDCAPQFRFVSVDPINGISVKYSNVLEAKAAVKELKLLKKAVQTGKRAFVNKQKEIRAEYTDHVRRRGSIVRGGGGVGSFFRTIQRISRDGKRHQLATALEPLEAQKQLGERRLLEIDTLLLDLEGYIAMQGYDNRA